MLGTTTVDRRVLKEHDGGLDLAGELDEIALPSTVRDLVGLKLAGLDEEQRETLETASVLGAEFEASLLAEVLDEKLIEISQRLAGLERKHRLLASSGKTTFRFARRQLYEAIYDSITPALRIGRPRQLYTGPNAREYVPIEER